MPTKSIRLFLAVSALLAAFMMLAPDPALSRSSEGNELSYFGIPGLDTLSGASVASGDYIPVYDASAKKVKKVDATAQKIATLTSTTATIGTLSVTGTSSLAGDVTLGNGAALQTDTTTAHTAVLKAYDVDGTAYKIFATLTNGNTPALALAAPSGGTLTIDGGAIGGTTPAAGAFTTLTLTGAATSTSSLTYTRAPSADSATTNQTSKVALTAPVDTTGTNTHNAYDVALTVSNASGGTNTVNGFKFDNYTGDAQVNVNAINVGTSDGLGTAVGLTIGTGWDTGISVASPVTGSGLTTVSNMVGFTRAIQTQQTTLTAAMCGSIVTNSGAVVSQLPEASTVLGCSFTFITGNASNFDVNPFDGTDQISLLTNAAGDAVRNATVGNALCLVAVSNDAWHQCSAPVGTWSDVN